MDKDDAKEDEYYSLEEFYEKNQKEPAEVKRLISEGAIQVFREADQVKLKPTPEPLMESEAKKKKIRKRRLTADANQYYRTSSLKFREENWALITVGVFMGIASLMVCGLSRPKSTIEYLALLFLGVGATAFIATLFLSVLSNNFFTRFVILSEQPTRVGDKKNLLYFFTKGYCYKQSAKAVLLAGCSGLVLYVIFVVMSSSYFIATLVLLVAVAITFGLHYYMYHIESSFNSKSPRKPLPFLEEDISNVFPGILPKEPEEKVEVDDKIVFSSLMAVMKNSTVKVRRDAIKALGKIGSPEAINHLVSALGDPEPEIRAQAVSVLTGVEDKSIHEAIKCLFYDNAPEVRAVVSEFLGYLPEDGDSLDFLLISLEDQVPEVRGVAAEALGRLGKRKAIKYLLPRMKDRDWFVRHKAAIALGKMKADLSIDAIEHLIHAVSDENEYVSLASEHILRKMAEEMAGDDPLYDEVVAALEKKGASDLAKSQKNATDEAKSETKPDGQNGAERAPEAVSAKAPEPEKAAEPKGDGLASSAGSKEEEDEDIIG